MIFKRLKQGLALSLVALVAACGSSTPSATSPGGSGYLLTVQLEASDTQASITQRYGGEVIAWMGDKAILKMTSEAVAQMEARGISMQNTTLESNSAVGAPEVAASGWNAWGSGWNAWSGGWNAWSSGWNAWSSGTGSVPTLPSHNRANFLVSKLPQAQAIARNYGLGVKVAVIDTGIDTSHPMLSGRLAPSSEWKDFIDSDTNPLEASGTMYGHGTAVAGLILQVAPRATILPIRVLSGSGGGDVASVVSAISWAISKGANVINLSLGTSQNNAALQTVVNNATAQGIYIVASAGNSGDTNITYPAAWAKTGINAKYLLSVGSITPSQSLSSFSSSGTSLEFVAVGEGISSSYPSSQTAAFNGTSFAAPQVSGSLALALSDTAAANKGNLETYLSNSGTSVSTYKLINNTAFLQQLPDFQKRKALFVVGSTTLSSSDSAVANRLQSLGYTVALKDHNAATASDATGNDIMLVSSSVAATSVNTKFRNATVPVVVWEHALYDDFGMTDAVSNTHYGLSSGATSVSISSTHPLAAGLQGSQTVFSSASTLTWGVPSSSAVTAATLASDSSKSVIFGYDKGAAMVGHTAPARRVGLYLNDFGAEKWTAQGAQLFEAAVTWAVSGN